MSSDGAEGGETLPACVELRGIAASPGVGIGPAYVVGSRKARVPHLQIERDEAPAEVKRFRAALRLTQEQLEAIKARLPHGEHRQILKAQQMMLRDPDFTGRTESLIRERSINAEWALSTVAEEVQETLGRADDEYFRERRSDVMFLAERVLRNLAGETMAEVQPPVGAIVVAHDLSPADTAGLARADVAGIVTAMGGRTSHSAIMARSLELPAVVGVEGLMDAVVSGDIVVVDGIHGRVMVRPEPDALEGWTRIRDRYEAFEDRIQKDHALPATAQDGQHIALRANVALVEEVASAVFHGAEGVGLYRTEYIFMNRAESPTEDEHYHHAKQALRRVSPYPVTIRTFDLGSDKTARILAQGGEDEENPAMGLRSLRLALRERGLFLAQLRGLMRAALHGPLRIMLPLVSGVNELQEALAVVAEAREQLHRAGMAHAPDVPVGIMIEMPSAAIIADLLAPMVDFMSIGTNDLIQYTLAIDRENEDVGYLYEPLHPAILRLLQQVTRAGADAGIPVSLCGEMAADPRYTWVLVGLGVRELSMHPSAVPVIKSIIRSSNTEEMRALAERALAAGDGRSAEALVLDVMRARFPEHLEHGAGDLEARGGAGASVPGETSRDAVGAPRS